MTEKPTDLLNGLSTWNELEPRYCQVVRPEDGWTVRIKINGEWTPAGDYISGIKAGFVLRAIQRRCENKGWGWWINYEAEASRWRTKVYPNDGRGSVFERLTAEGPLYGLVAAHNEALAHEHAIEQTRATVNTDQDSGHE